MKMLNLTLQQTMQPSTAFICNVNFLLNEFISTVKNTEKKDKKRKKKTFPLTVLENTGGKILPCFIMYFHNCWNFFSCFLQAFAS